MIDLPIFLLSILILGLLLAHHRRTVERLERELAGAILARDTAQAAARTAYQTGHNDATTEVHAKRDQEAATLTTQATQAGYEAGYEAGVQARYKRSRRLPLRRLSA